MEIGTEISRKIRTAIKGKLQELGAYVDEELPDYIMVMVANKKSQDQMTDDLSLFLGNNTARFTTWLQGVLDKLRSVAAEPNNMKVSDAIIFESAMPSLKSLSHGRGDGVRDAPNQAISSTRQERYNSNSSSHGQGTAGISGSGGRLTSAVKPLRELSPSEAVIDIKLDTDDPFIDDLSFATESALLARQRSALSANYRTSRPTAELYRPPGSSQIQYHMTESSVNLARLPQGGAASGRPLYVQEELSRKRRLPVVSSVVKVTKLSGDGDEEENEDEEEEEDFIARAAGVSSSVSVPARPERRPTLPPSKQANKNLILKAISEAQESITKTTNYSTVPQKQTVPVAPRTRMPTEEEQIIMHSRASVLSYQAERETQPEQFQDTRQAALHRTDLLSRLQPNPEEEAALMRSQVAAEESGSLRPVDSRSFILKRPKLSREPIPQTQNIAAPPSQQATPLSGRLIQPREVPTYEKPASPKFIVTLDGVPSPPGYTSDQELEEEEPMCYTEQGETYSEPLSALSRDEQNYQFVAAPLGGADVPMESVSAPAKEKIAERCRYWPACKNANSCAYHHPTAPCKAFPKCRFADKCFFIHPNCKYDAKCTKADCPYTHASKRIPVPPGKPAPVPSSHPATQQCRYFPACKKTECTFYHPKHCRFNTQCTRADCKFYHPAISVPPRHALTWTRWSQASD
ncbi:zinc finger CCCH domain-containing protein 14 [Rhinophrynus dorsalis]